MADLQQPSKSALQSNRSILDEVVMRPSKQRTLSSTIVIKLGDLIVCSDLITLAHKIFCRHVVHRSRRDAPTTPVDLVLRRRNRRSPT